MHFDAAFLRVPTRFVFELIEIEISAQFAIDARQYVQVEGGSYAGGIVVSQKLCVDVFD